MFRKLQIAALTAVMGLGSIAAMPTAAQADGIYFSFGSDGSRAGVYVGERGRHYRPAPPRRHACTPNRALRKAERMGLRRARVTRANRNIIRVTGRTRYGRDSIVFARSYNCPVIR
ncbi:hypothetical protein [Nitratireductor basaltis]|uniref:Antifreeze protein, type I n=1 Tax=Nitratireductor basaltis TaxID=472175 RepID=A0A084U9K2_9HYPH|nr:hypothetical protein [Nitratireductor basaltis]KFB09638.1 hypothetical protein EL18_00655 [Nitratireductor basaltis]